MKFGAVFIFVALVLASQTLAVLRPLFPVKAAPPFRSDVIIIGDDVLQNPAKTSPPKASK